MDLVAKLLAPMLDKLGSGWKRIVGLAAILIVFIANQMTWIDADTCNALYVFAGLLFGVGVIHRQGKQDQVLAGK